MCRRLITAYYTGVPDPRCRPNAWRLAPPGIAVRHSSWPSTNGTSSRSPRRFAFIESGKTSSGPLYLGIDTHALSVPACASALEVLAANGVEVMLAEGDEYTPTPVISHAILTYNRGGRPDWPMASSSPPRTIRRMTAASNIIRPMAGRRTMSSPIGSRRRRIAARSPAKGVKRIPHEQALRASTTHRHDYLDPYIADLGTWLTWTHRSIRSSGWALIRWAAPASIIGRESPSTMV
jgi:phosphoglucomutase